MHWCFGAGWDCRKLNKNTLGRQKLYLKNITSCCFGFFLFYFSKIWWYLTSSITPSELGSTEHAIAQEEEIHSVVSLLCIWKEGEILKNNLKCYLFMFYFLSNFTKPVLFFDSFFRKSFALLHLDRRWTILDVFKKEVWSMIILSCNTLRRKRQTKPNPQQTNKKVMKNK